MIPNTKNKDKSIKNLVQMILENLDERELIIVDHWESDLCSVGIARKDSPDQLVYLSTYNVPKNFLYYELEFPKDIDQLNLTYPTSGEVNNKDILKIISSHLKLSILTPSL